MFRGNPGGKTDRRGFGRIKLKTGSRYGRPCNWKKSCQRKRQGQGTVTNVKKSPWKGQGTVSPVWLTLT